MTFVYINPLILNHGHQMGFVSLALLVNGIAGVIGTSLGGILADKLSSKRWLIIAFSIFIVMMLMMNLILHTVTILLIGLFIWNIVQWSTNPAIQSGMIEHVEGDTSQVMSWNYGSYYCHKFKKYVLYKKLSRKWNRIHFEFIVPLLFIYIYNNKVFEENKMTTA